MFAILINKNYLARLFSLFVIITLLSILLSTSVIAKQGNNTPYNFHQPITDSLIRFYQNYISPISPESCRMYPSCSNYAHKVFSEDSFIIAFLKTSDRLLRCDNDFYLYEKININNKTKYADYVHDNEINNIDAINIKYNNYHETDSQVKLYNFALELKSAGRYEEAKIEFERFLAYFPESDLRNDVLENIMVILLSKENYYEVINFGENLLREEEVIQEEKILFYIGLSYLYIDEITIARDYLKIIENDKKLNDMSTLLIGYSYAKEKEWRDAINNFSQISYESKYYQKAQNAVNLAEEGKNLDFKDPFIAGLLGFIPGAGYLYSGHPETALSSFIVNTLLFTGAAKAFQNENYSLGILLGSFGLGFYSGNIYGSFQSAKNYNQHVKRSHLLKFNFEFEF